MEFIDFHCDTAYSLLKNKGKSLKDKRLKVNIDGLKKGNSLGQFFALFIDDKENIDNFKTCNSMLENLKNELNKNKEDIKLCTSYNDYINNKIQKKNKCFCYNRRGRGHRK